MAAVAASAVADELSVKLASAAVTLESSLLCWSAFERP